MLINFSLQFVIYFLIVQRTVVSENFLFDYSQDRRAVVVVIAGMGRKPYAAAPMEEIFVKEGSSCSFKSGFPTTNIATSFSIATGLYPKDNRVTIDPIFDFKSGKQLSNQDPQFFMRKTVEPIWVTNKLNGKNTVCVNWPGAHFKFPKGRCTQTLPYNKEGPVTTGDLCEFAVPALFDTERQPTLVLMYYEIPEEIGMQFGSKSYEYNNAMIDVSRMIMYLHSQLKVSPLANRSTLFVIGTHDFFNMNITNPVTERTRYWKRLEESGALQVRTPYARFKFNRSLPDPKIYFKEFLKSVRNISIIYPNQIPKHWETDPEFIGDALILARPGTVFFDCYKKFEEYKDKWTFNPVKRPIGMTGLDNTMESMKGFFWSSRKDTIPIVPEIEVTDIKYIILEALKNDKRNTNASGRETRRWYPVHSLYFIYVYMYIINF